MSLTEALTNEVRSAVLQALEESGRPLSNRLMDTARAAEYMGVEPDAIKRMHAAGKLPKVALFERKLMFDVKDLDRLIEDSK